MLDENKQTNNNNNKREHLIARCHPKEHEMPICQTYTVEQHIFS